MPAKKWSKELVISEFTTLKDCGADISPKGLREKRNDLVIQIRRKFGSYESFINLMGFDYEEIVGYKRWSKERIVSEVETLLQEGRSLRRKDLEQTRPDLLKAMTRHFGSYKAAITVCGLDYDKLIGFTWWSPEKVKEEFLRIYHSGECRTIEQLRKINRGLDHAVRKHFGGYDALCNDLELDVTKIRPEVYEWSKDDLLKLLKGMLSEGSLLNISSVELRMPGVGKVAQRHFGGYAEALKQIGEDIRDHEMPHIEQSKLGTIFERAVADMFEDLGRGYVRHKRLDDIISDFYCEQTHEIIDAKLSSWTVFNCKTIEKYLPKCSKLTIVYLRGADITHNYDNLNLINVSSYYEELRQRGFEKHITMFESLLQSGDKKVA